MNLSKLQSEAVELFWKTDWGFSKVEDKSNMEQFLSDQIQKAYSKGREEVLEIIDTEMEVDLKPDGENDWNDGFNDACLAWDSLLNITIGRIKRGVFDNLSIQSKGKMK